MVVADLIAQYACEDYSMAAKPLIFDKAGKLVECTENKEIVTTIKDALTSSACDPSVKRDIFLNLSATRSSRAKCRNYTRIINAILDEIRHSGVPLNLNYVDFTQVNIRDLDLSEASLMAAKFINASLVSVDLLHADLTGALFKNVQFLRVDFEKALMVKVILSRTNFKEVNLSGTNLTNAVYYRAHFKFVTADFMISEDMRLQKTMQDCIYDKRFNMEDSNLNEFLRNYQPKNRIYSYATVVVLNGIYSSAGADAMFRMK